MKNLRTSLICVYLISISLVNGQKRHIQDKQEFINIRGVVTSADSVDFPLGIIKGDPLIGVRVKIKGIADLETDTNYDGKYKLSNVPINHVIEFSLENFKYLEVKVEKGITIYNVSLKLGGPTNIKE